MQYNGYYKGSLRGYYLDPPNYPLIYPKCPLLRTIRAPLKGQWGVLVEGLLQALPEVDRVDAVLDLRLGSEIVVVVVVVVVAGVVVVVVAVVVVVVVVVEP